MLNKAINIYSRMADEVSKHIYLQRLNYSISQDEMYIEKMLDLSIRNSAGWRAFLLQMSEICASNVVLFGNGIWGRTLVRELYGYRWKCIIDNALQTENDDRIPVINADRFLAGYSGEKIVISSYKNREAMIEQCLSFGVREADIIDASAIIYELTEGKIYFDEDVLVNAGDGLFIDGGCYDGSDTRRYLEKYRGNAVCFEPDSKNIEKVRNGLVNMDPCRYRIVSKGLWSRPKRVAFRSDGGCGSHIVAGGQNDVSIETRTIDEEVSEEKVSIIKMDIEGAELEALKGARGVIERSHPILAISVYHKPEDILEIPDYILKLYDGYRLYLRHYSFSWYDTVLYAIPEETI